MPVDFFISYASPDAAWAEWVGWVLEEDGATVILQAWDFMPGGNFVLEMQRAAASAERTIAILSLDYLKSTFAAPEWAAAFAQDPEGMKRSLIPVRVRDYPLEGMLRTIVHIDLIGLDEAGARKRLLDGVSAKRGKPERAPSFPGAAVGHGMVGTARPFPGNPAGGTSAGGPYIPKIRGAISDLDRTRFIKQAFGTVQAHFERGLEELAQLPTIDVDFTRRSNTEFIAEAFVNGKRRARCRIWLNGGMSRGNQIAYYGGDYDMGNAMNEAVSIADDPDALALCALMNMGIGAGRLPNSLDPRHMRPEEAGEYLWRRFVSELE